MIYLQINTMRYQATIQKITNSPTRKIDRCMDLDDLKIQAVVYHKTNGTYYLKLVIEGMSITGFTARLSRSSSGEGIKTYEPTYPKINGAVGKQVEYLKDSKLEPIILDRLREAVKQYNELHEADTNSAAELHLGDNQ